MSALWQGVRRKNVPLCALTASGTTGRVLAKREERIIFAIAKRGRAWAFPLFAFWALTILYERKNCLIRA